LSEGIVGRCGGYAEGDWAYRSRKALQPYLHDCRGLRRSRCAVASERTLFAFCYMDQRALITGPATLLPPFYPVARWLVVVDSTVLAVDQQIAKSRQTSSEVSDQKTAPLRLCRLHA